MPARTRRAFTLTELLVVMGLIALLAGILLPVIARAQAQGRSTRCMANLQQIVLGLMAYSAQNGGYVVPSYNLPPAPSATTNLTGGPNQPLDGWACILDRDGFVPTPGQNQDPGASSYYVFTNTVFYCPDTYDVPGVSQGQTAVYQANPRGWADWPMIFTAVGGDSEPKQDTTIPSRNFNKVLRVGYWLNAYNPIGGAVTSIAQNDLYYTASVGYGPDAGGAYIRLHKITEVKYPSRTIVVADGLYMGRQSVDQVGMNNCRIGFRHPGPQGPNTVANAGFADGHVESISGDQFPCAFAKTSSYASNKGTTTLARQETTNLTGPTVYADPDVALRTFLNNNPGAK